MGYALLVETLNIRAEGRSKPKASNS
jgi:hypothetical protein